MRNRTMVIAGLVVMLAAVIPSMAQGGTAPRALDIKDHGYQHGYRDGYEYGRDLHARGLTMDYHSPAFESADSGYFATLGPREQYREGYRDGYRDGTLDGYNGTTSRLEQLFVTDRNFDPDGAINQVIPIQINATYQDVASDIGYRDGVNAGLKDFREHHKFRPTEHDAYRDAHRGYDKTFGSKTQYQMAYRSAYMNGYRAGFGSAMNQ